MYDRNSLRTLATENIAIRITDYRSMKWFVGVTCRVIVASVNGIVLIVFAETIISGKRISCTFE